jgi:hypothetical protein
MTLFDHCLPLLGLSVVNESALGDDADRVNHDALALAELGGEVGEFAVEDREGDGSVRGPDEHADHLLDRHVAHIPVIDLEENVPDENSPACRQIEGGSGRCWGSE